jgi:hypothetical protein
MDLDQLNPHSRRFAEGLLQRHPEWRHLFSLATYEGADPGTLFVEVPASHPSGVPLFIDSDGEEITVSFGIWHDHFGSWTGEPDEAATQQALDSIDDILAERMLIVAALDGEQWRASWTVSPGERIDTGRGKRTQVRSWLGTYDAELTTAV